MKLLEMENKDGDFAYMIKLETHAEFVIYNAYKERGRYEDALNAMLMSCGFINEQGILRDTDVEYYFTPLNKSVPNVGEDFKDDNGIMWKRIR